MLEGNHGETEVAQRPKPNSGGGYYGYLGNRSFKRIWKQIWDVENVNDDHENAIVCLGREYDPKVEVERSDDNSGDNNNNNNDRRTVAADGLSLLWPVDFLEDVGSKLWMTYRKNFPLIPKAKNGPATVSITGVLRGSGIEFNGFTTDVGWGCMIRTAQSLLANTLMILRLGRDWRREFGDEEIEIAKLFSDHPDAAFSLHNFVRHGEDFCGKMPGEWFGPSAAASSIKALCEANCDDLGVYISSGSDIYESELQKVSHNDGTDDFKPTLILIGIRLGIEEVNPLYWDAIREFLRYPQAVGIAGGRPSSSHYFFGYQKDNLFYLDPHQWQPALQFEQTGNIVEALDTVHTTRIRSLPLSEMDPSMLVGFLVKTQQDWDDWKNRINQGTCKKVLTISAEPPSLNTRSSISLASDDEDSQFVEIDHDDEAPVFINSSSLDITKAAAANDDCDPPVLIGSVPSMDEPINVSFNNDSYTAAADDEWEIMKKTLSSTEGDGTP